MVDITDRLAQIKRMIDRGDYFMISRARQYGKTTILQALADYLQEDYVVLPLDFQMIGNARFENEFTFCKAFVACLQEVIQDDICPITGIDEVIFHEMTEAVHENPAFALDNLFIFLRKLCRTAKKPIVMLIDEVDSATNNQVFLDFLAQLRAYYLIRDRKPTFQSVILAGVHDVKNIRRKIRPEEEHKINSPWNIAADFWVDMSFSVKDIQGMLEQYKQDHHTGMDVHAISALIFDYTSGYPFLVSRLCQLMDERIAGSEEFANETAAWTKNGFLEAVKLLLNEKNTLFDSLMGKLEGYPELSEMINSLLFGGERISYNPFNPVIDLAQMFGFVKNYNGAVVIANRIFEILLYDYFLTDDEMKKQDISLAASNEKPQFIQNNRLNMRLVLEKFIQYCDDIYGGRAAPFDEAEGRRRFLLFLRPIINGAGNYYIEAETRDSRRMDVVIDYGGEQFVVELKIWRGNAYNERGERQLADYLDYFHLETGYMLSYNFNRNRQVGVRELQIGERTLIEAVV